MSVCYGKAVTVESKRGLDGNSVLAALQEALRRVEDELRVDGQVAA
jgi:hypothetical protein